MTIDVNDLLDFYSVAKLAEIWNCNWEERIHLMQDQKSRRLGCSVKGFSNQIHAIYMDDDKELIGSLVGAFNQKLPIPSSSLWDCVRLHKKDIGAKQYDRLAKLPSNGTTKQKERMISDFIYEDVVNAQWAASLVKSDVAMYPGGAMYAGGVTWADRDYGEKLVLRPEYEKKYYLTGLNFEGDRFLFVEMDGSKEEIIFRPIVKSNFSTIPREEKERFENTHGMKIASDDRQIEPAVANISSDPITEDSDSSSESENIDETNPHTPDTWKWVAWNYALGYEKDNSTEAIRLISEKVATRMAKDEKWLNRFNKPHDPDDITRNALCGFKSKGEK